MNKEKYKTQQGINEKRGEYERERRNKYLHLKHLGQYFIVPKRSEVSKEIKTAPPKVVEQKNIMEYSFKITLIKGLKYFVLFLLPVLVDKFIFAYPELAQLSLGAILVMTVNVLKVKVGVRFP